MTDPNILDNESAMRTIDPQNMFKTVSEFPDMLSRAAEAAKNVKVEYAGPFDGIVVSGMGGSAIGGDIVSAVVERRSKTPIAVNRGYNLHGAVKGHQLFFAISYSGNTEETLSSLKDAEERGFKIVVIASGGKLSEIAKGKGYPLIAPPAGLQPRAALPALLSSVLVVLESVGVLPNISGDIEEAAKGLKKLSAQCAEERRVNAVKQLAQKLHGKVPIILACRETTGAAALRWVNQLNENSKMMAHLALFPELNHNEMVGLASLKRGEHDFSVIILRDEDDSEKIKKRIEITKSLIGAQMGGVAEVRGEGQTQLSRLLWLVLFGDMLSVYLAILNGVDPSPVEVIERFKKELLR